MGISGAGWSVWALSEWCGIAADPISPVVAPGFVMCRAGDGCEHACELGPFTRTSLSVSIPSLLARRPTGDASHARALSLVQP